MKIQKKYKSIQIFALILFLISFLSSGMLNAKKNSTQWNHDTQSNLINIRNTNGKFYAYIVLLFNENPHFVNLVQEDSIPLKVIQKERYNLNEYKNYLLSVKNSKIEKLAKRILSIYQNPLKYNKKDLLLVQNQLEKLNIILRFSKNTRVQSGKIVLDYCIYGIKKIINIKHPFFNIKEKIYNIQPFIYYDEFSTSNSTFYFDMIYINSEEVENDFYIAKMIIDNKNIETMFFVGARVSEDIKYCIIKAFPNSKSIKNKIWKMFIIHELTHKVLNNQYNYYDNVTGEELSLSSTIYADPYLGLSVMYSYLDYNINNPHRIAANNYIRFVAKRIGKLDLISNPSDLKYLNIKKIKKVTEEHFNTIINNLKK